MRIASDPRMCPLRAGGLLGFRSSRGQRPQNLAPVVLPSQAGSPSTTALRRSQGVAGLRHGGLVGTLTDAAIRLRLHRKAEQPADPEVAGAAGVSGDSGPVPCPGKSGP